jgi:hypothetical protein
VRNRGGSDATDAWAPGGLRYDFQSRANLTSDIVPFRRGDPLGFRSAEIIEDVDSYLRVAKR